MINLYLYFSLGICNRILLFFHLPNGIGEGLEIPSLLFEQPLQLYKGFVLKLCFRGSTLVPLPATPAVAPFIAIVFFGAVLFIICISLSVALELHCTRLASAELVRDTIDGYGDETLGPPLPVRFYTVGSQLPLFKILVAIFLFSLDILHVLLVFCWCILYQQSPAQVLSSGCAPYSYIPFVFDNYSSLRAVRLTLSYHSSHFGDDED